MINDLLRFSCDTLQERPTLPADQEGCTCYVKENKSRWSWDGVQWVSMTNGGSASVSTVRKTADQAFTTTAYANVTDLSFSVAPNTDYAFEFFIIWSSAATTTGVAFGLTAPASPAMLSALVETQSTATALVLRTDTANDQGAASASIDAANTNRIARVKGVLRNGANAGTLQLRCKSEVVNSAITVKRGSHGVYF